jgi:hypothetical protein
MRQTNQPLAALALLLGLASSSVSQAADKPASQQNADQAWQRIEQYFHPPAEFAGKLGDYRSPLVFEDGTQVKTPDDWQRRRRELLDIWTKEMGPWPKVLEKPEMKVLREEHRDGITHRRVKIEVGPKQFNEGWLLVPEGKGPFPAVLVVFYEPETTTGRVEGKETRAFGLHLAKAGFVTLNIGTPAGTAFQPDIGQAQCQPLSYHAYAAANCWHALANLPEVDAKRIGVVGHSYGGKWSLFAGALWDKFAAVAVSDPGIVFDEKRSNINYWEPWYLGLEPGKAPRKRGIPTPDNPGTGAYRRLRDSGHELHEIHALIAPRPFWVSGGSEDPPQRWLALNHLVAIDKLLGYENRVGMTNRPAHGPTEESNAAMVDFFVHFLKP